MSEKRENSDRKLSLTESVESESQKKPILKNIVTRLQFASRLARAQRSCTEEETDVVADDNEIKHFARQSSKAAAKRRWSRPGKLTLRQLSQLSRKSFGRLDSKVSDLSANDDEEYENGIISDGTIHFWKKFTYDEGHPFLRVCPDADMELVAKVMHKCWALDVPKIVTFIISNKSRSTQWTNQRQIKNFQKGLIDAAISTNMWVLTNGLNTGVSSLIGSAVKSETHRMRIKRTLKNRNLTNLIGIATEDDLRYGQLISDIDKAHIQLENEGTSYGDKYELNENHTHFILIKDKRKTGNAGDALITKFAELLTRESWNDSNNKMTATPDSTPDIELTIDTTEVPVVSILVEGDCETIKLVVDLIKRHIPVVVLRGSGGIADLIAFAYLEISQRSPDLNSWDLEFIDHYLKPMLTKKIISYYSDLKDNTLTRNLLRDRIIECIRLCKSEERIYLTVLNMHNTSSCNLEHLSRHLLLALLKSRQSRNEMQSKENFLKDIELTMDWNCANVAKDVIFAKNPNNINKLDKNLFESALIREDREEFVELFLCLGFPLHSFLSPSRLNRLFKLIHDNEFFRTICWENILGRPSSSRPNKHFIDNDLNFLIELCTGLDNFLNTEDLRLNVMGLYPIDSLSAERKALTLLAIWSAMQSRHDLAKVFWKYSDQPVHLALVISMIFDRLSWYAVDSNIKSDLKQKSRQFAEYANGVLDVCYNEDANRANNVLDQSIHDWNYKTAVDIAANAQLRQFLGHPCCQKYLTNTFLGNIRLREINWGFITIPPSVKIILCALFVFPLFLLVRFKTNDIEVTETSCKDEELDDVCDEVYFEDNKSTSRPSQATIDQMKVDFVIPSNATANECSDQKMFGTRNYNHFIRNKMFMAKQPPLPQMIVMFFSAPITKFYISQLFYLLFLPLLSLSVLYPKCGHWNLDLFVCFWITILCIDYIGRTYKLITKYTAIPVFFKCLEISLIIVFIILFAINRVLMIHIYSPYTQKLLLSIGVLYFYYRLIGIYLPISSTLGPLLHRLKLMITVDFVNYMRIAGLVILSNMIVIQAVLYPDSDLSLENFHRAFHRAFFSLWLTPVLELETNPSCESQAIDGPLADQCSITGHYNNTSCPNSGFWSYAFFIQYFIFLKLILSTVLLAIFAATAAKLQIDSDNIWKFQRYLLVTDFANRLPLPAPLSVFHYIYFLCRFLKNFFCNIGRCCANSKGNKSVIINNQNEIQDKSRLSPEECTYWRQLAFDYIEELKEKEAKEEIPFKQWEYIQNITDDLEYQKKVMREIKGKVMELERVMFAKEVVNTGRESGRRDSPKTSLSRYSPYPNTRIIRTPLSDKYIPWEVMHIDYEPPIYTKPLQEFPPEMQTFVDQDIILLKELKTRNTELKLKFPVYKWNSNYQTENETNVNRISWHLNSDGSTFQYKLEDNFIPLNPFGKTGLRGRAALPRWGPNHYVIFVITRWQRTPTKSKNLEIVIEELDNQIILPEHFVGGEDLFGLMPRLFGVEHQEHWVLPEVVNFFKSMCVSVDPNGFKFELIGNGYIDDPLNTDNAWKEAKVWHIHYECRDYLKKRLIDSRLSWRLLSDSLFSKMPLSHNQIIKTVVDSLKADII